MSAFLRAAISKARAIENRKIRGPSISVPLVVGPPKAKLSKKAEQGYSRKPVASSRKETSSVIRPSNKSAKLSKSSLKGSKSKKASKPKKKKTEGMTRNYDPDTGEGIEELSESDMSDSQSSDEESDDQDEEIADHEHGEDFEAEDISDDEKGEIDGEKKTKDGNEKKTKQRKIKPAYTKEIMAHEIFVGNITIHASPGDVLRACDIPKRNIENMRFRSVPVITETKKKYEIWQKLGAQEFVGRTKNAYIRFKDREVMHSYLQGVRNREKPIEFANLPLRINWAGTSEKFSVFDRKRTLFVTNLHHRVGEKDLTTLGQMVGKVEAARVLRDEHTFRTRRMGFIMFSNREERSKAIKILETKKLYGRQFYCHPALDKLEAKAAMKKYRKTHPKPPPRSGPPGKKGPPK